MINYQDAVDIVMKLYRFKISLLMILFACFGKRTSAKTTDPSNMGEVINNSACDAELTFTPDAQQLYIMSNHPGGIGGQDFSVSDWIDGKWTEPRNLGIPFNSPDMDHYIYFAEGDEEFVYWTSTRP